MILANHIRTNVSVPTSSSEVKLHWSYGTIAQTLKLENEAMLLPPLCSLLHQTKLRESPSPPCLCNHLHQTPNKQAKLNILSVTLFTNKSCCDV